MFPSSIYKSINLTTSGAHEGPYKHDQSKLSTTDHKHICQRRNNKTNINNQSPNISKSNWSKLSAKLFLDQNNQIQKL